MTFEVLHEHDDDNVILVGEFEGRRILGVVTREAIEDDTDPPQTNLSRQQRNLIAEANKELLTRHFQRMATAGMAVISPNASTPRVTIRTGDLRRLGTLLSARILSQPGLSWADPKTGRF